jgi:hypothetical protein
MRNLKVLAASAVVPVALAAGGAFAQSEAQACEVTVDRSQAAGTYDVTRQQLENGDCICYLYTGPAGQQSTTLENRVKALQASGECSDAPVMMVSGAYAAGGAAAAGAAASGGSFFGAGALLPVLAASGAGAVAVSSGGGNNDSPGG